MWHVQEGRQEAYEVLRFLISSLLLKSEVQKSG